MAPSTASRPRGRRTWLWTCGGFLGTVLLGCFALAAVIMVLRSSRPTARDLYSGAPDLVAGQSVSDALVDAGVQGASVIVIPITDSPGQIAIITLDESRGYTGFSSAASNNLQLVVGNIVSANRTRNLHIEQLSIDYRDQTGESSLAFTTTIDKAEAFADGQITQQEFVGAIDFNLADTLRHYGLDQILEGAPQP